MINNNAKRLNTVWQIMKFNIAVLLIITGLDKFLTTVINWNKIATSTIGNSLPFKLSIFLGGIGLIELIIGLLIILNATKVGSYIAMSWFILVAIVIGAFGLINTAFVYAALGVASFSLARLTQLIEVKK